MTPFLIDHLLLLAANELVLLGVWKVFEKDMILGPVGDWIFGLIGPFWAKPLFECPPCMGSVWGSIVFWLTHPFTWHSAAVWPFYCLALCGISTVLTNTAFEKDETTSEKDQNARA